MQAKIGFNGRQYHYEQTSVTLASGVNTSTAVTFDTPYLTVPVVQLVPHHGTDTVSSAGESPKWNVKTVTKTGFVFNITPDVLLGGDTVLVTWFAHEQM